MYNFHSRYCYQIVMLEFRQCQSSLDSFTGLVEHGLDIRRVCEGQDLVHSIALWLPQFKTGNTENFGGGKVRRIAVVHPRR